MAGPITIAVIADVAKARAGLNGVTGDLGDLGGKTSKFGAIAKTGFLAAGAAAVAFGVQAVSAASDAQQSVGATETVFGKYAKGVIKSSQSAAQAYGLSANEYRENANLLGALFKNQGVAMDQLGGKTEGMIGQAADLAATFGGTTKDAVEALGSAFKGEFDPLEKYGISIKQSTINAELAARGQDKLTGAALKQAQQVATTDLIMKQAASTQGAFARESDTLAGASQRLGAQWTDIKAKVGTALLPVLTGLATVFNQQVLPALSAAYDFLAAKLGPVFAVVKGYVQQLADTFGGAGGGGLSGAVAQVRAVFGQVVETVAPIIQALVALVRDNWSSIVSWTKSTFAQIKSTMSSTLGLISAILATIRSLWARFGDDILSVIKTVWTTVGAVIKGALNIVQGIIRTATAILKGDWSGAWEGIKQILRGAWDAITAIIRGAVAIVKTIVKAAFGVLKDAAAAGVRELISFVGTIPGRIKGALSGAATWLVETGKNVVRGLISGIGAIAGDVTTALLNLLPGPLKKFAGKLGIQSPSKVFAEFGKYVGEGFIQGIVGTRDQVASTMRDLAELVAKANRDGLDAALAEARPRLLKLATEYETMKTKLESLSQAFKETAASVRDGVLATGNVTSFAASEGGTSFAGIVAGLKDAKTQAREWKQTLAELGRLGLNKASLGQLAAAGPEQGLDAARAIAEEGKRGVREINALQSQIAGLATKAGKTAADAIYREGKNVGSAVIKGLRDGVDLIEKRMEGVAERLAARIRAAVDLEVAKPVQPTPRNDDRLVDEMGKTRKAIERLPRDYKMNERTGKK